MSVDDPLNTAVWMVQEGYIDEEHRPAATILLHILGGTQNADTIAKKAGLNRDKVVRPAVQRLRQNGLLDVQGRLLLDEPLVIGFAVAILVARGVLERHEA